MFTIGAVNMSIPSSIHHRKIITNHSAMPCNANSKCAAAAKKKKKKYQIAFVHHCPTWAINTRRRPLNRLPTTCNTKLSDEVGSSVKITKEDDKIRREFLEVYSVLKWEVMNDPSFEWTHDSRLWLHQDEKKKSATALSISATALSKMLDYNVPGGKLVRGLSVMDSYKSLKGGKVLSEDEVFDASVVGWCIEWLQASLLMHDDIMDNSHTRRGQPCWFRVPTVGKIAVNDGIILWTQIPRILKKHFRKKPYYVDLLDLFNEVEFQTVCGQMLDLITNDGREKDLSKYSLHLYRRIAQYKTGYYSFYLPVACALLIAGENLDELVNVKDVLLDIGIYFQVVDDYLDCFGDPEKTGKIGSDIEDFKCSWLVVKALELANEEQKKIIHEHYGKANPNDVAKVIAVYNDINLRDVFLAFERESYNKIKSSVEAHPNKAVQGIWATYTRAVSGKQWF